jgi:molecular chaperone IbpA
MGCSNRAQAHDILLYKEKIMNSLTRFDTNSLAQLNRALVGFDQMFDGMERRFASQASNNYPPHNIAKIGENLYEIQIAVTGFNKDEITVQIESNELTVRGESKTPTESTKEYLHRGLALRDFSRAFTLAEHMKVIAAEIKNGILTINIEREIPESAKPKVIDIVEIK